MKNSSSDAAFYLKWLVLLADYYEKELSEDVLTFYVLMVSDIPPEKFLGAIIEWTAAGDKPFMLKINELRELALASDYPSVDEVYSEVRAEVVRVGMYGTPKFSHPLIDEAVQLVGWRTFCESSLPAAERKHLMDVYTRLIKRKTYDAVKPASLSNLLAVGGDTDLIES